jgi:hypothetical protein
VVRNWRGVEKTPKAKRQKKRRTGFELTVGNAGKRDFPVPAKVKESQAETRKLKKKSLQHHFACRKSSPRKKSMSESSSNEVASSRLNQENEGEKY